MKAPIIIGLAISSVIVAVLTSGIVECIFSLLAFSLVFYYASTQQDNHKQSNDNKQSNHNQQFNHNQPSI